MVDNFISDKMSEEELGSPLSELDGGVEDVTTLATKIYNLTEGECFAGGDELGVDVLGLVSIIIFYVAVLGVGQHFN